MLVEEKVERTLLSDTNTLRGLIPVQGEKGVLPTLSNDYQLLVYCIISLVCLATCGVSILAWLTRL